VITPFSFQASARAISVARWFLSSPNHSSERAVVYEIQQDLAKHPLPRLNAPYVEWECVEHGVIHVFDGEDVIQLDPSTGTLETV
jgi:hypothetical protein